MRAKFLSILLLVVTFSLTLYSQNRSELDSIAVSNKRFSNSIGFGAGFTTGFGISYRYFGKKNGVQINFFPLIEKSNRTELVSAGVTLLHKIVEAKKINLYLYLANSYLYSNLPNNNYNTNVTNYVATEKWNTGIGTGFEWDSQRSIVLDLMGGFAQYNSFNTITLTAEFAIYCRFD